MFYNDFLTLKNNPIISFALTKPEFSPGLKPKESFKYYNSYGVQEDKQEVINGETVCKLTIPLPGYPKENISVKIFKDKLEVSAKYQESKVHEVFYDSKEEYDLTKTKATYLNGLLTIIVPLKKDNDGTVVFIE